MKTIVLAVIATLAIAAAAAAVLSGSQRTAYQAYATSGARVSEPGHNLVGPNWSGRI
jgi:DNA-binding transcriptional regulator of glucitol operon